MLIECPAASVCEKTRNRGETKVLRILISTKTGIWDEIQRDDL